LKKRLTVQTGVVLQVIDDYRSNKISLNTLIQKVEGVCAVVGVQEWEDRVFLLILDLEQINAAVIEEQRALTRAETVVVSQLLITLESLSRNLNTSR
jgi:hypothetical protein